MTTGPRPSAPARQQPTDRSHVVLLRGVNVGGHRRVPSADLRSIGEEAGFTRPVTLLASGNLVVGPALPGTPAAACQSPADVAALVRSALADRLGLDVDVVVTTRARLDTLVARLPFPDAARDTPSALLVTFYAEAPDPARTAALDTADASVVWDDDCSYTAYPDGVGRSRLTPAVLRRALGVDGTARNWTTVLRLRELAAERDGQATGQATRPADPSDG